MHIFVKAKGLTLTANSLAAKGSYPSCLRGMREGGGGRVQWLEEFITESHSSLSPSSVFQHRLCEIVPGSGGHRMTRDIRG